MRAKQRGDRRSPRPRRSPSSPARRAPTLVLFDFRQPRFQRFKLAAGLRQNGLLDLKFFACNQVELCQRSLQHRTEVPFKVLSHGLQPLGYGLRQFAGDVFNGFSQS